MYYCFMAMKCGANAKPPSNDPCAACLGPGFISIMRSIYSVVMTWGYEKSQILLKTQAHPANPVWKDGLIHRWNSHDMSAHTTWKAALAIIAGKLVPKTTAVIQKIQRIYEYWIRQDYIYALNLISWQHGMLITFVFTLKPQYMTGECLLFVV